MKIVEQIQSLEKTEMGFDERQLKNFLECQQFVEKMKRWGLIHSSGQRPAPLREGGLEQLKHLSRLY